MSKQRIARMQRRAARRSIAEWSQQNAGSVRSGIIEQMQAARRTRRLWWALAALAVIFATAAVTLLAGVL